MIKSIDVQGLYDVFDHKIDLKKENITMILGENGLGKTIILKIIKSFFDKNFNELFSFPYKKLALTFTNNSIVDIEKEETEKSSKLIIKYSENPKSRRNPQKHEIPIAKFGRRVRESIYSQRVRRNIYKDAFINDIEFHISNILPYPIERIGPGRWFDHRNEVAFSTKELLHYYKDLFPEEILKEYDREIPDWLIKITESTEAMLIETQRLLYRSKESESEYKSSVIKYAQELVEKIKNKTVAATDLASKLDRSYPNRVVNEITKKNKISDTEIASGLEKLAKQRELLNKVGLIDTEEEHLQPITDEIVNQQAENRDLINVVLQVYINDSNDKLSVYDDLAKKLELLINIINKRFLYKRLTINKKNGFIFKSTITQKEIPITGLSSGEQHELVLFYQLLFNTIPNSLLLIDEPEISLHISWQNHFIDDLREVIKLNNFSAIIATHSPDIINNNWSLTVKLSGANND